MILWCNYKPSDVHVFVRGPSIWTREFSQSPKRNGIHRRPLICPWSNHKLGSESELASTSSPEVWACYWSMLGVVWSVEKRRSGCSHRFLYSVKRDNKTEHQRPHGKPPSSGMEHQCPGTLRRRCHSQRLCGIPLPRRPAPQDAWMIWRNATGGWWRVRGEALISPLGFTGPDLCLLRNGAKASSPGLYKVSISVSTTCGSWFRNCFQRSTLQVPFSKFIQSASKTKGILSLLLLEVMTLTPQVRILEFSCSWIYL